MKNNELYKKIRNKLNRLIRILGPGVITGAADDDPSGIATYSQTGAQFGYGQLWAALFTYPLMTAVQEACARIGAVRGRGLASVIRENYSKKILYAVVALVVLANTINIGADIGAMAEAAKLIIPLPFVVLAISFTVAILLLEIFTSYAVYSKILKWLTLSLLAYPITAFIVGQPWGKLLEETLIPNVQINFQFLFILTGVFGTTISPYMFFWEASEEVEEELEQGRLKKIGRIPRVTKYFIKNLRLDNIIGMLASNVATWFIIVVGATVLHANNVTNIATAADAARALEPLVQNFPNAGFWAKTIFAIGIIGLGFLGVPVLAGSASYALSEAFKWNEGLSLKLKQAHGFYGVITIATLIGLLINFIGIDPIKALIFAAVFNGVTAVPLLFIIAKIARNKKIMGDYVSGNLSNTLVWITFIVMGISALAMFFSLGR